MHFYIYDTPGVTPLEGLALPFAGEFDTAVAELIAPNGLTETLPAVIDGDDSTATLPLLDQTGTYLVRVSVVEGNTSLALPPVRIPVESAGTGWHTIDTARTDWQGGPPTEDHVLFDLLTIAREQVLAFAPARDEADEIPTRYRQAQLMQARNTWNATVKNPRDDTQGFGDFAVPVFPLDWSVKRLIRPIRVSTKVR